MALNHFCQRPKTTRRHVHPPVSERMFTLFAEGKIVFGEHNSDIALSRIIEHRTYFSEMSCAIWPLYGTDYKCFDFRNVKNQITEDGTPIHGVVYQAGDMEFSMECFCNTVRKATMFAKVQIKNTGKKQLEEQVSFLMRTAFESNLVYGKSDSYVSYDSNLEDVRKLNAGWYKNGDLFTDGSRQLTFSIPMTWKVVPNAAAVDVNLAPGETMEFTFKLDRGEVDTYDYEQEKAKTIAFWQKELSRINKLPAAIAEDPKMLKAVRHMVTQLLQLFAVTIPENLVIPRQGGMQRVIWPTEALSHIEGLCRIGDFGDYIEPVFDTYFKAMQLPTGEIGKFGIYWGSMTAAVLYSYCMYCDLSNPAYFDTYRDKAYAAFRFIKDLRRSVTDTDELAGGLFPILRGIDWTQQFQCWTSTDVFNVLALDALATTFLAHNDPAAQEIRQEHTEYLADMKRHFKKYYDAQEGSDTLRIPLKPMGDDTALVEDFYPLLYQGRFVYCGVIDNEKDMRRVYNEMVQSGITIEGLGLYGHLPYRNGKNSIWYLSFPDYYWFELWMQYGDRKKAKEVLDAQLRYCMTEEYYFLERLDTSDPYFLPWTPNASATGRTLIMLSKYYS